MTGIAVHGGAGVIRRRDMAAGREAECHEHLRAALEAGHVILRAGGAALDAVEAAVVFLEDCPLFNAGRGAVFTRDGTHELDASIMDGNGLRAGAVAAVRCVRNPVRAARAVMERTRYVLLTGDGADAFARAQGLEQVTQDWFSTELRRRELERVREAPGDRGTGAPEKHTYGTVGAVAVDAGGGLAAATSTGGLTNKHSGRVGDSAVIGAGTYAENGLCAVSATGDGEYFMRCVATHEVAALMRHAGLGLAAAAERVVHGKLTAIGGSGGLIAIAADGMPVLCHNTPGMYRGAVDANGRVTTAIFADR